MRTEEMIAQAHAAGFTTTQMRQHLAHNIDRMEGKIHQAYTARNRMARCTGEHRWLRQHVHTLTRQLRQARQMVVSA